MSVYEEPITENWIACGKCSAWWKEALTSFTKGPVITPVIIASVRTLSRQGVQEWSSYTSSLQWPCKIGKIFERLLINFIVNLMFIGPCIIAIVEE